MRALIVDDERPARDRLRRLLEQQTDITAIAEARDGVEALQLIALTPPDIVFLDIQMPEMDGVELAAQLPAPLPLIVFVTAFDRYAVEAFDANAIDYLLKPYDEARFMRAMDRLRERWRQRAATPLARAPARAEQLLISDRGRIHVIKAVDIVWLEANDNYVAIHTRHGQPLMRQTLSGLLEQLGDGFVRTQRGAAVNLACVEQLVSLQKGDGEVILHGGVRVPCSRQYRAALMARLA